MKAQVSEVAGTSRQESDVNFRHLRLWSCAKEKSSGVENAFGKIMIDMVLGHYFCPKLHKYVISLKFQSPSCNCKSTCSRKRLSM